MLVYHSWPSALRGGLGVDVFFVVSGYLITAHLLREADATGRVSLLGFWAPSVALIGDSHTSHWRAAVDVVAERSRALRAEPAAIAAESEPRAVVVDLTRFFCDARRCLAVVGGALVHRDVSHMTTTFATTLGPYLLRAPRLTYSHMGI